MNIPEYDANFRMRLRAHDSGTWSTLFEEMRPPLLRRVARLLSDRASREDVVHDVFFYALQKADDIRPTGSLRAWLLHKAYCLSIDRIRKRNRRRTRSFSDLRGRPTHLPYDPIDTAPLMDEVLIADGQRVLRGQLLVTLLATLTPEQRALVSKRYFEGMTIEDTAEASGVTVGAANYRLGQAEKLMSRRRG